MAKTMPRSKAADKLLKGMPEEDPTIEAPSAPQADSPAMPDGMADMAPMDASTPPGLPPDAQAPAPEAGAPPGDEPDIDSALSGVEAAIQGYSEDSAREIRTHLEAIKDIASREDGREESQEQLAAGQQDPSQAPPDMPSSADLGDAMGMDERR